MLFPRQRVQLLCTILGNEDQRSKTHWAKLFALFLNQTQDAVSRSAQEISNTTLLTVKLDLSTLTHPVFWVWQVYQERGVRGPSLSCWSLLAPCAAPHQLTLQDTRETANRVCAFTAVMAPGQQPQACSTMPQTKVLEVQADFKIKLTGLLGSTISS